MKLAFRPALWPVERKEPATWNVRLGRVVHWISAGLATLAFGVGLLVTSLDYKNQEHRQYAIAAWDQRHPKGSQWPGTQVDQYGDPVPDPDPRPYEGEPATGVPAIIGLLVAGGILLSGRGVRYIVGGE